MEERETLFELWARRQGVHRPFKALAKMDEASRHHVAELLSIDLNCCFSEAVVHALSDLGLLSSEPPADLLPPYLMENLELIIFCGLEAATEEQEATCNSLHIDEHLKAEAEACLIIGRDGNGIQARSHSTGGLSHRGQKTTTGEGSS
jgi:hypothetical protein